MLVKLDHLPKVQSEHKKYLKFLHPEDVCLGQHRFPIHQEFKVPKMEVYTLTYISCMDTAYLRESPPPETAKKQVQETLHFRYLKWLVTSRLNFLSAKAICLHSAGLTEEAGRKEFQPRPEQRLN